MHKKNLLIYAITLLIVFPSGMAHCLRNDITEDDLRKGQVIRSSQTESIQFNTYGEYNWVKIGSRKGAWKYLTNRLSYLRDNIPLMYFDFEINERMKETDSALKAGSYIKFTDGYFHLETGFGMDVDYLYKFMLQAEAEHRLIKTLFLNVNSRYMHYDAGDVYLLSPGLVYYFGNNYLNVNYGISFTDGRGSAHNGSFKGTFYITKNLRCWAGVSLGERLFDIIPIKSVKQYGYDMFAGLDIVLTDSGYIGCGFTYSKEDPFFIKRGIVFRGGIKF